MRFEKNTAAGLIRNVGEVNKGLTYFLIPLDIERNLIHILN